MFLGSVGFSMFEKGLKADRGVHKRQVASGRSAGDRLCFMPCARTSRKDWTKPNIGSSMLGNQSEEMVKRCEKYEILSMQRDAKGRVKNNGLLKRRRNAAWRLHLGNCLRRFQMWPRKEKWQVISKGPQGGTTHGPWKQGKTKHNMGGSMLGNDCRRLCRRIWNDHLIIEV